MTRHSSEPWQYARRFDYIHTRVTSGCWSSFEDQIVRQAHEWLEPGGYLEAQEVGSLFRCDDGTLGCDSHLNRWARDLQRAARTVDRPLDFADKMQAMLRRAGFVDVQERIFKMPLNAWPRDEERQQLGRLWERNFSSGMTGFSVSLFHQVFARSPAETEVRNAMPINPRCWLCTSEAGYLEFAKERGANRLTWDPDLTYTSASTAGRRRHTRIPAHPRRVGSKATPG